MELINNVHIYDEVDLIVSEIGDVESKLTEISRNIEACIKDLRDIACIDKNNYNRKNSNDSRICKDVIPLLSKVKDIKKELEGYGINIFNLDGYIEMWMDGVVEDLPVDLIISIVK
jgi:hypothetical protein